MSQFNIVPILQLTPGLTVKSTDVYPAVDTTDPTQSPQGTTKQYTINELQTYLVNGFTGNNVETAYVGTTANLNAIYMNGTAGVGATLTNNGSLGALVIDGITLSAGQSVLVSQQSASADNGVYIVTVVGDVSTAWVLTRAPYFDNSKIQIAQGDFIGVLFGSLNALTWWFLTSPGPFILGTTSMMWEKQVPTAVLPWINQTTSTASLAINTGYTTNNGASLVTYTLPISAPQGAFIEIMGYSSGKWKIAQNAGQSIQVGSTNTNVGVTGSLAAILPSDTVRLVCILANDLWAVASGSASFTIT